MNSFILNGRYYRKVLTLARGLDAPVVFYQCYERPSELRAFVIYDDLYGGRLELTRKPIWFDPCTPHSVYTNASRWLRKYTKRYDTPGIKELLYKLRDRITQKRREARLLRVEGCILFCPGCRDTLNDKGTLLQTMDASGYCVYRCGCGNVSRWNADMFAMMVCTDPHYVTKETA